MNEKELIIQFVKKNFGSIAFYDDGSYKLFDIKDIDNEIKDKKDKKEFLNKLKKFELID